MIVEHVELSAIYLFSPNAHVWPYTKHKMKIAPGPEHCYLQELFCLLLCGCTGRWTVLVADGPTFSQPNSTDKF